MGAHIILDNNKDAELSDLKTQLRLSQYSLDSERRCNDSLRAELREAYRVIGEIAGAYTGHELETARRVAQTYLSIKEQSGASRD